MTSRAGQSLIEMPVSYDDRNSALGFAYAFIGMILLSCNFVTVKYSFGNHGQKGFNPESLTVVWTLSATFFALVWAAVRGEMGQVLRAGKTPFLLILRGAASGINQLMAWQGLQRLDPSFATSLGRFAPMIAIVLGALFLKERIRILEWIAIVAMIAGGVVSTLAPGVNVRHAEWSGIALSLGGCFFAAIQWPVAKLCGKALSVVVMNLYRVSIAALVVLCWGVLRGNLDFAHARLDQWVVLISGAFLGPFLSHVFTYQSYRHWDMARSAVIWTLEPLIVVPLALMVFGTVITGWRLARCLIVLGGALMLAILHHRAANAEIVAVVESC